MKHLAVINHQDSFIYNLIQILRQDCGTECTIYPYESLPIPHLTRYDGVILSPGPGTTDDYPRSTALLQAIALLPRPIPVLGICMGMQQIGVLYGGTLYQLPEPAHGAAHKIVWQRTMPEWNVQAGQEMQVGLYHSWALRLPVGTTPLCPDNSFPTGTCPDPPVVVDAYDPANGAVMALHHPTLPFYGLQFHPESILTPGGRALIKQWIKSIQPPFSPSLKSH